MKARLKLFKSAPGGFSLYCLKKHTRRNDTRHACPAGSLRFSVCLNGIGKPFAARARLPQLKPMHSFDGSCGRRALAANKGNEKQ